MFVNFASCSNTSCEMHIINCSGGSKGVKPPFIRYVQSWGPGAKSRANHFKWPFLGAVGGSSSSARGAEVDDPCSGFVKNLLKSIEHNVLTKKQYYVVRNYYLYKTSLPLLWTLNFQTRHQTSPRRRFHHRRSFRAELNLLEVSVVLGHERQELCVKTKPSAL